MIEFPLGHKCPEGVAEGSWPAHMFCDVGIEICLTLIYPKAPIEPLLWRALYLAEPSCYNASQFSQHDGMTQKWCTLGTMCPNIAQSSANGHWLK